jgi:hypothetical protein
MLSFRRSRGGQIVPLVFPTQKQPPRRQRPEDVARGGRGSSWRWGQEPLRATRRGRRNFCVAQRRAYCALPQLIYLVYCIVLVELELIYDVFFVLVARERLWCVSRVHAVLRTI